MRYMLFDICYVLCAVCDVLFDCGDRGLNCGQYALFWSKILIIRGVSLIFGPRLRLTLGRTNGPRGGQGGQIGPGEDVLPWGGHL